MSNKDISLINNKVLAAIESHPLLVYSELNIVQNKVLDAIKSYPSSRYNEFKKRQSSFLYTLIPRSSEVSRKIIEYKDFELASRFNAEICFSQRGGSRWKERMILTGLLSLLAKDYERAAIWLSGGINQIGLKKVVSRSCTYGYSYDFIEWIDINQNDLSEDSFWVNCFSLKSQSNENKLVAYVILILFSVGMKTDVKILLNVLDDDFFDDLSKAILIRLPGGLIDKPKNYSFENIEDITKYNQVEQKVFHNVYLRVFSETEYILPEEKNILPEENSFFVDDNNFNLLCQSFELLIKKDYKSVVQLLGGVVKVNQYWFSYLDKRKGVTKVFIGGYGWSGSSAIHDVFRGHDVTKDMPGVGFADHINEGADSEPMIHQGPAGIFEFIKNIQKKNCISIGLWRKFFRLYVLRGLHRDYFEYKTVNANAQIQSKIGVEKYYLIILNYIFLLSKAMLIKDKKVRKTELKRAVSTFEKIMVGSLFHEGDRVILFNNSINTNNVKALRYIKDESVYLAVNRNIFDQVADQRKSNVFYSSTPFKFVYTKNKKIKRYSEGKKSLENISRVKFIDVDFEEWVKNKKYRALITQDTIGTYSLESESRFFDPKVSIKNTGIYDAPMLSFERLFLGLSGLINKKL